MYFCCRKGEPSRAGEWAPLFSTQKGIISGDRAIPDKPRNVIGRGHWWREQQGKENQDNCSAMWLTISGFMVQVSVPGALANHLACARIDVTWVLPGDTHISQPRWTPVQRILGGCWEILWVGVSFLLRAPSKLSQLVFSGSILFLIKTSCFKTTHASGYHLARPRCICFGQSAP